MVNGAGPKGAGTRTIRHGDNGQLRQVHMDQLHKTSARLPNIEKFGPREPVPLPILPKEEAVHATSLPAPVVPPPPVTMEPPLAMPPTLIPEAHTHNTKVSTSLCGRERRTASETVPNVNSLPRGSVVVTWSGRTSKKTLHLIEYLWCWAGSE